MDGVICDFVGAAIKTLGGNLPPEGTPEFKKAIDDCQMIPDFYRNLEPIPGAIDAYHALWTKYQVEILSAPSWDNDNSWGDKKWWCQNYLGDKVYKRLSLTHNKGFYEGRALIDDRTKYGVLDFKGEHIHFGTDRFPNWEAVLKYLL